MINLSDYFQPLNFQTLSIYLILLFFFDSLGILIFPKLKDRFLHWLIGLGFFVFIWFVLGFFVPPKNTAVILSVVALGLISFSKYLKNKQYLSVLQQIWQHKLLLLIIFPFLPAIFIKASLPPYYADEMAYHFISPQYSEIIGTWVFNGGVYQNVPRLLNTFMILIFAITKTYSVFRLFHFSILATSLLYAFKHLKQNFSLPSAILFTLTFLSLPTEMVLTSTLGYVDVATYSFLLIAWVAAVNFYFNKNNSFLFTSTIFWAMALGTKYTPLTAAAAFSLPTFLLVKKYITPKILFKLTFVFIIFGGYWYFKNLYFYGNPTYPFLFPCFRYADQWCNGATSDFFYWTTKIDLAHFKEIMEGLFPKNRLLQILVLTTPVLVFFSKKSKQKTISLWLLTSIVLEFLLLKKFSGFYLRYQQHLQLLLLLLLAIQIPNQYKVKNLRTIIQGVFIVLSFSLIVGYVGQIKYSNSLGFINWTEINYARGRLNIYDWINQKMPRMLAGLNWCEHPPSGQPTPLARFDPDMVWYEYDGFMRSFMTNCYYENPPLEGTSPDEILKSAKTKQLSFWTITPNGCLPQDQVIKHLSYEDNHSLDLRKLNNIVVCNSQQVEPNLYYFDYQLLE